MVRNVLLVLFGVLIGLVVSRLNWPSAPQEGTPSSTQPVIDSELGSSRQQSRTSPIQGEAPAEAGRDPGIAGDEGRPNATSLRRESAAAEVEPIDAASSITQPTSLPEAYAPLTRPPRARVMRADELFDRFSVEERDEQWAYSMELGINQHIAASNVVGTTIESVECRATLCVVAGYVQPGYPDRSRQLIGEMTQTGWWQLSRSTISTGSDMDGTARFVHILPRTDDDMMEFAEPNPSDSSRESSPRSQQERDTRV